MRDKNLKCYTMALDGDDAEITMYGEIVESRPKNWWTGEVIDGDYIVQSEFLADLESVADAKSITLRMNSLGGDAGVSVLIHNRLRELAANGTKLTCVVDGCAMSGGSLIMCACDTVQANPSSLIMIHKAWSTTIGNYNADELREQANALDAWDKAQASIYQRKTGLSNTIITHMMSDTTYMTGAEAVEKGFADELIEDAEPLNIAASADRSCIYVRDKAIHLAPGMLAPESIPLIDPETSGDINTSNTPQPDITGERRGESIMANTLEQVPVAMTPAEEQPEALHDEPTPNAMEDAVQAERQRIREIDELAGLYDPDIINAAKYGENACSAQEMTFRAAKAMAAQGRKFVANMEADNADSGAQNVGAVPANEDLSDNDQPKTEEQKKAEAKATVKNLLGKKGE